MENISQILKEAWENIKSYETGSLQLGIPHPLEWHVAYETPTNKALIIIAHKPAVSFDSSKSINTVCHKRDDGTYYISFQLIENSQEDVFISMCSNLIEYSSDALTEKDSLNKVSIRYKQWRKLMEHRNQAILSDEKRRGLIGELLYMKSIIEESKSMSEAIAGWVGPDGADQDFVYDGLWREIKTTGLSSDQISIHSLEQLGNRNEVGELHIYRVDSCAPEAKDAFTLRGLISYFVKMCGSDLVLIESFTNKLNAIGYVDMEIYDNYPYKYFQSDVYDVDETFPRICRNDVRTEIIRTEYVLSISSIDGWKRGNEYGCNRI